MRSEARKVENQHPCFSRSISCFISGFNRFRLVSSVSVLLMLVLFSTTLLSGCGFQLRGYGEPQQAQFKAVKLSGLEGVSEEVQRALRDQLKASSVTVMPSLVGAELDIKLQRTYTNSSKTSYTGSGDVASVLITLKQAFSVEEIATETLLLSSEAIAYRDHSIDSASLLASSRELKEINQQMANEVVSQLVDQINRRLQASLQKD